MAAPDDSQRSPVTDSPWFWFYLFCTAALVALVLMRSKYGARQAQIEQQFQGRQHAGQTSSPPATATTFSNERRTVIQLDALFLLMAVGVAIGWFSFCWQRMRRSPRSSLVEPPGGGG